MKRVLKIFLSSSFAVSLMISSAFALNLGTNITIPDGVSNLQYWHGINEDQEVEPGCSHGQIWDLEGFYLKTTWLTMVGGFDFEHGNDGHPASSLFIDTNGDAGQSTTNWSQIGYGHQVVPDNFGYEYAINFNFTNKIYNLFGLSGASTTSVYYFQNDASNPMGYVDGGQALGSGSFTYTTGLSDSDVGGLQGGTHNALSLNLAGIIPAADLDNFVAHYTMYCGNDNLMGKAAPVPEPASMLLFGTGLIGLAAFTRRKLYLKK